MNLYNTSALFDQNMSDHQQDKFLQFYGDLFGQCHISSIHDCTIGAGGTTLPLADLGYRVSGSDLSDHLLKKAKDNFSSKGHAIEVFQADFRSLAGQLKGSYDCLISTGNSIAHVKNQEVEDFILGVSAKIKIGGYLFLDQRNWDKILREKPIFTARAPLVMTANEHTSLYHLWNWHYDGSVDFVFVTSTDRDGKHEGHSCLQAPTYYPLIFSDLKAMLEKAGFKIVDTYDVDYLWLTTDKKEYKKRAFDQGLDDVDWYGVLAKKVK